jgi:4'-phosphopantetheinyl transferase
VNTTPKFVNFNFNLSHHSEWVVLGSEPSQLIGVDVMDMQVPRRKEDADVIKFFNDMNSCFTPYEWKHIKYTENLDLQVSQFFRNWTLKEGRTFREYYINV